MNRQTFSCLHVSHNQDISVFLGYADLDCIFPSQKAPKATPEEWALWLLHHEITHLSEKIHTVENPAFSTDLLCVLARALSFIRTPMVDGILPDNSKKVILTATEIFEPDMHPTAPIARFDGLCPKPVHFDQNLLARNNPSVIDSKHASFDFEISHTAFLLGCANALFGNHQATLPADWRAYFQLLDLLTVLDLPSARAFPQRSNNTGWSCIFRNPQGGSTNSLALALHKGLILPSHLLEDKTIFPGLLLEKAHGSYCEHPAYAFAQGIAPLVFTHGSTIGALHAAHSAIRFDAKLSPDTFTGHQRLAIIALRDDILTLGAQTGAI